MKEWEEGVGFSYPYRQHYTCLLHPLPFEEGRVGGDEGGKVMEIGTKEVGAPTRVNNIALYSVHCTGLRATSYPCSLLHS